MVLFSRMSKYNASKLNCVKTNKTILKNEKAYPSSKVAMEKFQFFVSKFQVNWQSLKTFTFLPSFLGLNRI